MTTRAANLLVFFSLALCGAVVGLKATWSWVGSRNEPPAPRPLLTIDPAGLDFGEVWEQSEFRWALNVTNESAEPLHVRNVSARCDCTAIEPRSFDLAPAETRELDLQINLTSQWKRDESIRDFTLPVTFSIRDVRELPGWTVRGRVRRNPIALSVDSLDFDAAVHAAGGAQPSGDSQASTAPASVLLTLPEDSELSQLEAECRPADMGTTELTPVEARPGRYWLWVQPAETLPAGPFSFVVRVSSQDAGGRPGPARELNVFGTMSRNVIASPWRIEFGAQQLREGAGREFVTLTPPPERSFAIEVVRASGSDVAAEPATGLAADPSAVVYRVTQRFTHSGPQAGWIEFEVKTGDGILERVRIVTSYYGLSSSN